ncbi:signal transduction histidine kinase [Marmoricola sp. URHA0025 HA25]
MADAALRFADAAVGIVLLGCAAVTSGRHRRVGLIMAAVGVTWFLGSFLPSLVFLHRGPMVHLHISYPTGRLRRPLAVITVAGAYLAAVLDSIARNPWLTAGLAILIAVAAADVFALTSGPARKAAVSALIAACAFAGVLALSSANGLLDLKADRAVLVTYDAVVCVVVMWLMLDLRYGRWTEATMSDLVIQLGRRAETGGLQGELRRRLGDPSLVLGYRVPGRAEYVDESGMPVDTSGANRVHTPIVEDGEPVAVLVHDPAILEDSGLVTGAVGALRLALVNTRTRAEVQARVADVERSRRRIVEAADAQRRAIERALDAGPERHLRTVAALLEQPEVGADPALAGQLPRVLDEVAAGQAELRQFAHGVRPALLAAGGLTAALPSLTAHAGQATEVSVRVGRLVPAVEAALYFVCAEALGNVTKHAGASSAVVDVREEHGSAIATITDDGRGGADPHGSGLRGLTDRVEALGGTLLVVERPGGGTSVTAKIPLSGSSGP